MWLAGQRPALPDSQGLGPFGVRSRERGRAGARHRWLRL